MEYRELAESNGIEQWRRVPALNTDERFIDDMADIVVSTARTCVCVCMYVRTYGFICMFYCAILRRDKIFEHFDTWS